MDTEGAVILPCSLQLSGLLIEVVPMVKGGRMRTRQHKIVELVRISGYVAIEDLARDFKVTPQTILRDIEALSRQGLLKRYHGGGLTTSVENIGYSARQEGYGVPRPHVGH